MINILHAIDTTGPGGAETVFIELLSRLDRARYKAKVVIRGKGWVYDELRRQGFEPYIVPAKGSFNLHYLIGLIKIIRKDRINIIQSHLLGSNVYCCLAGWFTRTPVVTTFHGAVDVRGEKWLKPKLNIVGLMAKAIVFVSEKLKHTVLDLGRIPVFKVKVIYNGIEIKRYRPGVPHDLRTEFEFESDDIVVGSIGNIRSPKAYDVLLRAAKKVVEEKPNVKFVVAGDQKHQDLYQNLITMRQKLQITNNVFFIGFRSNVPQLLQEFDLFLLSSSSEACPVSVIEAMATGVPIVVTACGAEELVLKNVDGLTVPTDSPQEIANAILNLLGDEQLRDRLRQNALKSVSTRFSVTSMVEAYGALYNSTAQSST